MTRNTQPVQSESTEFYTVSETARHLRLCEKQVRRLIWRGDLPAFRFGTALRIAKASPPTSPAGALASHTNNK